MPGYEVVDVVAVINYTGRIFQSAEAKNKKGSHTCTFKESEFSDTVNNTSC